MKEQFNPDDLFEIQQLLDGENDPYAVYSLHHKPTGARARIFFDRDDAAKVLSLLDLKLWKTFDTKGTPQMLENINQACDDAGIEARKIVSEETGEFIAWCYGRPDILHAVDQSERANGAGKYAQREVTKP